MPAWQEAPRGVGAAIDLAEGAGSWADACCGPHRMTNKTAPRRNRAVEKLRMQLPVGCEFGEGGPVVASEQDNVTTGTRWQARSMHRSLPLGPAPKTVPIVLARVGSIPRRPGQRGKVSRQLL